MSGSVMGGRCSLFSSPHLIFTSHEVTYYYNPYSKSEESEIWSIAKLQRWLPGAHFVLFITKQDQISSLCNLASALGHYLGPFSSSPRVPVMAFSSGLSVLSESQWRKFAKAWGLIIIGWIWWAGCLHPNFLGTCGCYFTQQRDFVDVIEVKPLVLVFQAYCNKASNTRWLKTTEI